MVSVCSMVTSYWNWTLSSMASGYTVRAPPSNSSNSMRMVVLGEINSTTCLCIMYVLISKHVLVVMCMNLSKYMFSYSQTCFLSSPRWACKMGRIRCMCTMTYMLLNSLACDQKHFWPCLLCANFYDGSITCMAKVSSIFACCATAIPTPAATHSLICATLVLPWLSALAHVTPYMVLSLPSCDLHVTLSPCSFNLQSFFHHEWTHIELTALLHLSVVNNLPLAFVECGCDIFCCCWWCYSLWWCYHSLDILVNEQLHVFVDRKVHKHVIAYILSCALNGAFDSAQLEDIILVRLGCGWHLC